MNARDSDRPFHPRQIPRTNPATRARKFSQGADTCGIPCFKGSKRIRMAHDKSGNNVGAMNPVLPAMSLRRRISTRAKKFRQHVTEIGVAGSAAHLRHAGNRSVSRTDATSKGFGRRKPPRSVRLYIGEWNGAGPYPPRPICRPIPADQPVMLTTRKLYSADNPAASNLPLAARRRVGHIGPAGDVAEWLKAAVC